MRIPTKELKELELQLKKGSIDLQREWVGFDPRKNLSCKNNQSMQRSILLSYCRLVGQHLDLSKQRSIEIGVEKHRHVCLNLGLSKWERLDRLDDVGGNRIDYNFDFVEGSIPDDLSEAFDVVICCNTLEHTFDIFRGFEQTFRMAKKGALLYFSVPFSIGIHGIQDYWRLTPYCCKKMICRYTDNYVVLEENWQGVLYGVSSFAIKE